MPLDDKTGDKHGQLDIIWGGEDDNFDPISQVRNFTASMELKNDLKDQKLHGSQSVKEIVPSRQFASQEIQALASFSGFDVAAMFGALDNAVDVNDEEEAFRLVCVLRKAE